MFTALNIWLGIVLTALTVTVAIGSLGFQKPASQGKKAVKSSQKWQSQKLAA